MTSRPIHHKLRRDLEESRIDGKVIVLFLPIAFVTYLIHESGHWAFGELLGNDMVLGLNSSAPKSGHFIHGYHALWSALGGPAFTLLQALVFFLIARMTRSIHAYSAVFFAAFSRLFSIVFGGIDLQDEARIASALGANKYCVAAIVMALLFLVLWWCTRMMKLKMKAVGYFAVLGTTAMLIVIGVNGLIA